MHNESDFEFQANLAAAREGDSIALDRILRWVMPLVISQARNDYYQNWARYYDESDIQQQVLEQVSCGLGGFRGNSEGEFVNWVRKITSNRIAGFARYATAKVRRLDKRESNIVRSSWMLLNELAVDDKTASRIMANHEQANQIQETIQRLTDVEQDVVNLRFFEGMKIVDIARTLELSEDKVRRTLKSALKKIRQDLVPKSHEPNA